MLLLLKCILTVFIGLLIPDIYKSDFGPILKRVRKVIKMFRNSPTKNALLQENIKKVFKKSLHLILDVKTRWNSTEAMLQRFLQVVGQVVETLNEIGKQDMITEEDIDVLRSLLNTLQPIRLASEALGRKDANLLTAEGTLNFLFSKLKKQNSRFSNEIYAAVLKRISERRNKELVSLMKFLQSKNLTGSTELPVLTRAQLTRFIKEEAINLVRKAAVPEQAPTGNPTETNLVELTMEEELESAIQEFSANAPVVEAPDVGKVLQKELTLLELNGNLSHNLGQLLSNLKSIKPTSIESERIFSISSNICNQNRSRLSDKSLNAICFLKSYFKRIDNM